MNTEVRKKAKKEMNFILFFSNVGHKGGKELKERLNKMNVELTKKKMG